MKSLGLALIGVLFMLFACDTTVTLSDAGSVGGSGGMSSTGGGGGGVGGAETYCGHACQEILANGPPQCEVNQCESECAGKYKDAETYGCLSAFIAVWECVVDNAPQDPHCQAVCEEQHAALQACYVQMMDSGTPD